MFKWPGKIFPREYRLLFSVTALLGCPISFYCLLDSSQSFSLTFLVLALATGLASLFPVRLASYGSERSAVMVTASDIFIFAGILLISPEAATSLAIIDCVVGNAKTRHRYRALLNLFIVATVTFFSGKLFYLLVGTSPPLSLNRIESLPLFAAAFTAAALFYFAASSGLISWAAARSLQVGWLAVWKREFFWSSLTNFTGVLAVSAIFISFNQGGVYSVVIAVPIVLIMYYSYRMNSHRIQSLRKSRQFFQSTLDSLSTAVAILDASGRILSVNSAWSDAISGAFFGSRYQPGSNYLESCDSAPDPWKAAGRLISNAIQKVAQGHHSARFEYSSTERKDESWYAVTVTRFASSDRSRIVVAHEDVTELRKAEKRIIHLAYYDELTLLPNRSFLYEHLKYLLVRAERQKQQVAVLALDLDNFERINTSFGHGGGDSLLCGVAERLRSCLRKGNCIARDITPEENLQVAVSLDTLGRLGGDEFLLVLTDIASAQAAAAVARGIQSKFKDPFRIGTHDVFVSVSIGISLFPNDDSEAGRLLQAADTALYHAKQKGKNTFQFYATRISKVSADRLAMEARLRQAVDDQQLTLHYQPRTSTKTRATVGAEALVRLENPAGGLIPPAEFIPIAEETGVIIPMTQWVLRTACQQAREWQQVFLQPIQVSVNLSARHFREGGLLENVRSALRETGLNPNLLELEITESMLLGGYERCAKMLVRLKEMGVSIALDDFGTGYSSLSYLSRLPIDTLKIDRFFLLDLTDKPENKAIIRAISAVARSLGLKIVAEGVETREQLSFLEQLGCQEVQGYYFSPPVAAGRFEDFLRQTEEADLVSPPAMR